MAINREFSEEKSGISIAGIGRHHDQGLKCFNDSFYKGNIRRSFRYIRFGMYFSIIILSVVKGECYWNSTWTQSIFPILQEWRGTVIQVYTARLAGSASWFTEKDCLTVCCWKANTLRSRPLYWYFHIGVYICRSRAGGHDKGILRCLFVDQVILTVPYVNR